MSRRRPCHTGGDSLSFKEFALALWTFASLDINGIGRFTTRSTRTTSAMASTVVV